MSDTREARLAERNDTARRVFNFIQAFFTEYGHSPSMEEIAVACFFSRTTVLRYLDYLEAKGCITRTPGLPRSIALLEEGDCHL